jgi:tripartite-type tricarboxylate transporter receptor subunit TctC
MLALALFAPHLAWAQDYPIRPIKMIVPFPPAGGTDNVARVFAQQVSQDLGQSIIIENRSGAAGMIGADAVANTSSILDITSTTKGFLPPRMTTTQVNAIATPAEGLVVFNTTISHLCVYQAGAWVKLNHSPM